MIKIEFEFDPKLQESMFKVYGYKDLKTDEEKTAAINKIMDTILVHIVKAAATMEDEGERIVPNPAKPEPKPETKKNKKKNKK